MGRLCRNLVKFFLLIGFASIITATEDQAEAAGRFAKIQNSIVKLEKTGRIAVPVFRNATLLKLDDNLVSHHTKTGMVPLPRFAKRKYLPIDNALKQDFAKNGHLPVPVWSPRPKTTFASLSNKIPAKPLKLQVGISGNNTHCLAMAIYHEARGESERGQLAVAKVILNRVKSSAYPETVCKVVYQNHHKKYRCQFSFACDRHKDEPVEMAAWWQIMALAKNIMCTPSCSPNLAAYSPLKQLASEFAEVTHYHVNRVMPSWGKKLKVAGKIGAHIFYNNERV